MATEGDVMPSGGFRSAFSLGDKRAFVTFDPDEWLTSTFRALKDYLMRNADRDIYEIVGSFVEADDLARELPLKKTIIHFEVDIIDNNLLGFGDGVVKVNEDEIQETVSEEEAVWHEINFDVGVWASDGTGGVTARMDAYQLLCNLLSGPSAEERFFTESEGVEIRYFRGGRFDLEKVNDVRLYRAVDMELLVRVAGRKTSVPKPYITDLVPESHLEIGEEVLSG
jgi:hypothetical protein